MLASFQLDANLSAHMKNVTPTVNPRNKPVVLLSARPRMTRQLVEKRGVGNPKASKFDGVLFLRSLKE